MFADQRQQDEAGDQRSHDAPRDVHGIGAASAVRIACRPTVHQHGREKSD